MILAAIKKLFSWSRAMRHTLSEVRRWCTRVSESPVTESQGRVHTSAVTVAVLPEAEADIEINQTICELIFTAPAVIRRTEREHHELSVAKSYLPTGMIATSKTKNRKLKTAKSHERASFAITDEWRGKRQIRVPSDARWLGELATAPENSNVQLPQDQVPTTAFTTAVAAIPAAMNGDIDIWWKSTAIWGVNWAQMLVTSTAYAAQ